MTPPYKDVEEALAEKARLLNLSSDAILVRDAADRITFWNEGATQTYGYGHEEAVGQVSHDLLRTLFPEPLNAIQQRMLEEGRWAGELIHTRKDGSRVTVSTRWSLERDPRGNVLRILESNRDISEMRQAQQAQYRLAAIVESSDDAIVSKDLNGTITSWNAGAQRIFGFSSEEAVGQPITIIIPPELQDEEKQILRRLRAGERVEHFETIRQRKDGTRRYISLSISPIRDPRGRVIGASKIARDVTDHKRIEQALKEAELSWRLLQLQDEEKRRIARELHDSAGQLLAALSMNIDAILREEAKVSAAAHKSLEDSRSLVEQIIAEIRTVSYLLHPPLLDELGLPAALSEYVEGFNQRSGVEVTLTLPKNLERLPKEYELSLFRMVQECLTNIHRHSGSPTAQVRLAQLHGEISLEVCDQGRGMSREVQERFFAGSSAGVGLRGMRERIRQLGGSLEINSGDGGTTVLIALPTPRTLFVSAGGG